MTHIKKHIPKTKAMHNILYCIRHIYYMYGKINFITQTIAIPIYHKILLISPGLNWFRKNEDFYIEMLFQYFKDGPLWWWGAYKRSSAVLF